MNILRVVAAVLPERWSDELLVSRSLVQFAASVQSKVHSNRAHKATEILQDLAEAFSVSTFQEIRLLCPHPKPLVRTVQDGSPTIGPLASLASGSTYASGREVKDPNFATWTVEELCNEVVHSSCAHMPVSDENADVLYELKEAMAPGCGAADLVRQLEASRIENGKEPWRWDWQAIGDVLEYSFEIPERCTY